MDFSNISNGIEDVVSLWVPRLQAYSDQLISEPRNSQQRSIRQILGHLVDSASNNHQRMVRLQYNKQLSFPDYRQDNDLWISIQDYQHTNWEHLVQLWYFYNLHMIQLINSINPDTLHNSWTDFEGTEVSLKDMVEGYLVHLNLHIAEIEALEQQAI